MTIEVTKDKANAELADPVDVLVMCQWFGCDKPATLRVPRANTFVCDDHYVENVLRFGCEFTTEPVNQTDT